MLFYFFYFFRHSFLCDLANRYLSQSPRSNSRASNHDGSDILASLGESVSARGAKSIDSALFFRLTMNTATVLISGSTDSVVIDVPPSNAGRGQVQSDPIILQVVSNALIMFQSIENDDEEASGTKTLHISLQDLSAAVKGMTRDSSTTSSTVSNDVVDSDAQPVVEPSAAEFRIVYSTQNLGSVVSQDFSLHCDSVNSTMTLEQMIAINSIVKVISKTVASSRGIGELSGAGMRESSRGARKEKVMGLGSLIRYKKSGAGIATSLRLELDSFSFILHRPLSSTVGMISPLFDFNIEDLKGNLEGCVSALYGDVHAIFAINYFRADVQEWEYVVEPFKLSTAVEQMPNEIVSNVH